eukprot:942639-Pyramimonas_sp.AAC.1
MAAIRPHYCKSAYIGGSGASSDKRTNRVGWEVALQLHNSTERPTTGSGCEVLWRYAIEKRDVTGSRQIYQDQTLLTNQRSTSYMAWESRLLRGRWTLATTRRSARLAGRCGVYHAWEHGCDYQNKQTY